MPHLRPDEGNSCCKQPPLVKESSGFLLARLNSIGSVDSFISPDQLLKSAGSWSSHSWSTALKENSRVPAAAAFTAGDVLVRSSPVCKQVSDGPVGKWWLLLFSKMKHSAGVHAHAAAAGTCCSCTCKQSHKLPPVQFCKCAAGVHREHSHTSTMVEALLYDSPEL